MTTKRVQFRNSAVRAVQNMKIDTRKVEGGYEAKVAGQNVAVTKPTLQDAVVTLKSKVAAQATTNEGLQDFKQTFV